MGSYSCINTLQCASLFQRSFTLSSKASTVFFTCFSTSFIFQTFLILSKAPTSFSSFKLLHCFLIAGAAQCFLRDLLAPTSVLLLLALLLQQAEDEHLVVLRDSGLALLHLLPWPPLALAPLMTLALCGLGDAHVATIAVQRRTRQGPAVLHCLCARLLLHGHGQDLCLLLRAHLLLVLQPHHVHDEEGVHLWWLRYLRAHLSCRSESSNKSLVV